MVVTALATSSAFGGASHDSRGTAATPDEVAEATAKIQDGKVEVNGVRYHYLLARGSSQTVVLLHGWASTSYMWRFVMPQLVAKGYTVLAPGHRL